MVFQDEPFICFQTIQQIRIEMSDRVACYRRLTLHSLAALASFLGTQAALLSLVLLELW
jgi:hypothetical protein